MFGRTLSWLRLVHTLSALNVNTRNRCVALCSVLCNQQILFQTQPNCLGLVFSERLCEPRYVFFPSVQLRQLPKLTNIRACGALTSKLLHHTHFSEVLSWSIRLFYVLRWSFFLLS